MKKIQTGIDKLLEVVAGKKRVSVDDAAKILGVSSLIVQEWADFLEEQGLISVDYAFSKVYMEEKTLTKDEVRTKAKEYSLKKEGFISTVQSAIASLDRETMGFEDIKEEFAKVKKQLGSEVKLVEDEMNQLKHFEDLKKNIDTDILKQKEEYQRLITESSAQISAEEKKYAGVIQEIEHERQTLDQERLDIKSIEEQEADLFKKLEVVNKLLKALHTKMLQKSQDIKVNANKIERLRDMAERAGREIKAKKEKSIQPLVRMSEQQKQKILRIQDDILKKVKTQKLEVTKTVSEGELVTSKFKEFFEKKMKIEDILGRIENDKIVLKNEMTELIKKAHAFSLLNKKQDVKQNILELQKEFEKLETKRSGLRKEMNSLLDLLKT